MPHQNQIWRTTLLVTLLILSSCKQEKSGNGPAEPQDQLVIELFAVVPENDKFEVYFRGQDETYLPANREEARVQGSTQIQAIVFTLDPHVFPSYIRLDLGENRQQGEIYLEKLIFRYNQEEIVFGPEEIKTYFRPNPYLEMDFAAMKGRTRVLDTKYDPYLDSNNISKFVNKLILY